MLTIIKLCAYILIIILFTSSSVVVANVLGERVCPSVETVKAGNFNHWLALNIDSDEPASFAAIEKFKKRVRAFSGAQWSSEYLFGFGRCNYGADMQVYLASDQITLSIRPQKKPWQWDGIVANCLGTIQDCAFL